MEPGPAILEFVRQIENLPPAARAFWDAATRRVFDIGFESGQQPHCPFNTSYSLGPDVLAAVARVRGELNITIYALDDGKDVPAGLLEPDEG